MILERLRAAIVLGFLLLPLPESYGLPGTGKTGVLDTDRDGLSDREESDLLERFAPLFMISRDDCSDRPAQFLEGARSPTVVEDDGTIYGQAFPRKGRPSEVELHYYHLWRRDCGEMGHRLDAEHVSVLVRTGASIADAKALYWYAAAHEDTICDASHLARAATLHAEEHGGTIWISEGKHASFLSEAMCTHGCGGDRCARMKPLKTKQIINLGEVDAPMNGMVWLNSIEWSLSSKLSRSDFPEMRVARVERLPETDIVWANPAKRPAQATILGANAGIGGAATGIRATDTALDVANSSTSSALDTTAGKTGKALKTSSRNVWKAVKKSVQKTGEVLHGKQE
ncbi:hypothetical protein AB4Y89_11615 [Terriglobus sp. 2YAB30_2]